MIYLGIDPGKSGAIGVQWDDGFPPNAIALSKTPVDVIEQLRDVADVGYVASIAIIEKVHSSPQMGVKSAFTFGQSYGWLLGVLDALRIPYEFVTPQKWQKAMGCLTGGDKNVSKAAAQRLWPNLKITHANADALLIAEYCRRTHK